MGRFLFYCGLVIVVTPFVLPVFWSDLTWSNWRIFVPVGAACAVLLLVAAVVGSRSAASEQASPSRFHRAIREFLDPDE
jgi:NADH:ubiquinone oxidoreductase subunit 6 (subunit J)